MKPLMLAAALGMSVAAWMPAPAMAQVEIVVNTAPPPLRAERVPVARAGYVWVQGYWNWRRNAYVWEPGHWERVRAGHVYRAPEWVRDRHGWRLVGGGWQEEFVQPAPPPPRAERVPYPRDGYVWSPGHWFWAGNQYVWREGHWLPARAGYRYHGPNWVEREGRWVFEEGRWGRGDRDHDGIPDRYDRDRDGDGIPNRYDRRDGGRREGRRDEDRDGVPNRFDRDRDGDGVPNRADPRPDNPRR